MGYLIFHPRLTGSTEAPWPQAAILFRGHIVHTVGGSSVQFMVANSVCRQINHMPRVIQCTSSSHLQSTKPMYFRYLAPAPTQRGNNQGQNGQNNIVYQ